MPYINVIEHYHPISKNGTSFDIYSKNPGTEYPDL